MSRQTERELLQFPEKPYEKTALYADSIRLKELMYHVVSKELDKRAKYRQGEDLARHCDTVCRTLISIYVAIDPAQKRFLIAQFLEEAMDTIITLRAIDNSSVHMSKESYTSMLGILIQYVTSCKNILSIPW